MSWLKRLFKRKEMCMICGMELKFDSKMGDAKEFMDLMAFAAYKCRKCGELICARCTRTSRCSKCGGNVFERVVELPDQ